MYKRALMLTAATVALLSSPAANAASTGCSSSNSTDYTDITKQISVPICTNYANKGAAGNITVESNGSLSVNATASSNGTIPAIELNSNNTITFNASSSMTFTDVSAALGVQIDPKHTGELVTTGTWDLSGNGTDKAAIVIGNSTTPGTFTGIKDTTNNLLGASTDLTAIALDSGSTIKVRGDGSYGIHLLGSNTLDGDMFIDGSITMQPTNLNATTTSGAITGIELDGNMTGDLLIDTSGVIDSYGAGARGVVVIGKLNGSIQNLGYISTIGSATTNANGTYPLPGTALAISNNVTGGIYNGGPIVSNDSNLPATISSNGDTPTIVIEPAFDGLNTAAPIKIGTYHDTLGDFSLINRGSITSAPLNANSNATSISIQGASGSNVTMTGLLNTGTISAAATNNVSLSSGLTTLSTAISIGAYTNIKEVGGYAITNSNVSGTGKISALASGEESAAAYGVLIAANASVPSLFNSGNITASVAVTDSTVSSILAYGIADQSGTLLNIVNEGSIVAQADAVVNGTVVALDNHENLARAIYLGAATKNITITNTGSITGDIVLGSGDDTITVSGTNSAPSTITGNIDFGGGADALNIGNAATVTGDILTNLGGHTNITIGSGGTLVATNNGSTTDGLTLPSGLTPGIAVQNLDVQGGGTLELTLADAFNIKNANNIGPVVQANLASGNPGSITLEADSVLKMNFGGFVTTTNAANGTAAKFVVFDATSGNLHVDDPVQIEHDLESGIPFLFTGSACAYNVSSFTKCSGTNPEGSTHDSIVLTLQAKDPATAASAGGLGLHGYALKMFERANEALANDSDLGAAVINAGSGIDGTTTAGQTQGSELYQKIYSAFAPDVSGAERAIAISLTDQGSNVVGARQRALRMYAGQDSDFTLWSQEFGQRLNVPNKTEAAGYTDTGFGFVLGGDGGDVRNGRYGMALTFYAGNTSEKQPRESKTNSEWYMLTGYQDWRGRGLFFDSQVSIAYGHLNGKRTLTIDDVSGAQLITRTAEGKRATELAAGGFTTGAIFNSGGTVFIPQISFDGLTMRQESYTETGGGAGMDLHVEPSYANSLRAFTGVDLRQDLKIGDYFLQPEVRAGFRYDFLKGAEKLKAWFAGDQTVSPVVAKGLPFTITGPDPGHSNLVAGGGLAVTTDAWSVGVNYDYVRGIGGSKATDQTGMITLVGRI